MNKIPVPNSFNTETSLPDFEKENSQKLKDQLPKSYSSTFSFKKSETMNKMFLSSIKFQMQSISNLTLSISVLSIIILIILILNIIIIAIFLLPNWKIYLTTMFIAFLVGFFSASTNSTMKKIDYHLDQKIGLNNNLEELLQFKQNYFSDILSFLSKLKLTTETLKYAEDILNFSNNSNYKQSEALNESITEAQNLSMEIFDKTQSEFDSESKSYQDIDLCKINTPDSAYPPISEWDNYPLYIRFLEEKWVIDKLKKNSETSNSSIPNLEVNNSYNESLSRYLPNYEVNYPYESLKIKNNSITKSEFINSFETPFFKGRVLIRIKGLENNTDFTYFSKKKRVSQTIIQGKFKYPYKFSEVLTGQIFNSGLKKIPVFWLIKLGFSIIKKLSPNLKFSFDSQTPFALSPLISVVQSIHVSQDSFNNIPDISIKEISENTLLLGKYFFSKIVTANERKNYFRSLKNLNEYSFNTDLVYTMDFYQHLFNFATYEFNLGLYTIDISTYLNGNPIEAMAIIDKNLYTFPENVEQNQDEVKQNVLTKSVTDNESNIRKLKKKFSSNKENNENCRKFDIDLYNRTYLWRIAFMHEKLIK